MKRRDAIIESWGLVGAKKAFSSAGIAADVPHAGTIGDVLRAWVGRVTEGRFRRIVTKALALSPRGFVPDDVLVLRKLSARLQVEWRSRDLHPWDRDLPPRRRAERVRELTLDDTDAAIMRLFRTLPDVDGLEVRVFAPLPSDRIILAGVVAREDAFAARSMSSPGMRLRMMGVQYRMRDGHLEPLD
jgi:hypothetical protein